jgi:hypothetical protein
MIADDFAHYLEYLREGKSAKELANQFGDAQWTPESGYVIEPRDPWCSKIVIYNVDLATDRASLIAIVSPRSEGNEIFQSMKEKFGKPNISDFWDGHNKDNALPPRYNAEFEYTKDQKKIGTILLNMDKMPEEEKMNILTINLIVDERELFG